MRDPREGKAKEQGNPLFKKAGFIIMASNGSIPLKTPSAAFPQDV